ncbi:MAG: hypothetical protein D3914_16520 [Candidatus Electrothrix sp. LOE2]|nr:hypothetical protein [Candidatus Electrothrix sp. LOE2]
MKKYKVLLLFTLVVLSSGMLIQSSSAAFGPNYLPDVSGLTVDEAHAKYGVGSGYDHPLIFEVNAKTGPQECIRIGPDCSYSCAIPKIYTQSSQYYLNRDGSRTLRVDVYYDINEPVKYIRKPSC